MQKGPAWQHVTVISELSSRYLQEDQAFEASLCYSKLEASLAWRITIFQTSPSRVEEWTETQSPGAVRAGSLALSCLSWTSELIKEYLFIHRGYSPHVLTNISALLKIYSWFNLYNVSSLLLGGLKPSFTISLQKNPVRIIEGQR